MVASEPVPLTFCELERLEAERKLRSIPAELLQSSWAREAQVEAVIDALLVIATSNDDREFARARHTGEWAARIAAQLPGAPPATLMRRCGVLRNTDSGALEQIPEVRECAEIVRAFQSLRSGDDAQEHLCTAARIIRVAEDFEFRISDLGEGCSPKDALWAIWRLADSQTRPVVEALVRAIPNAPAELRILAA